MNSTASENSSRNHPLEFSDTSLWLRAAHGSVLAVLLTAILTGNLIVVGTFILHKKLRQRSFVASLGLVVADLLLAVTLGTQGISSAAAGHMPFGNVGCTVLGSAMTLAIATRWCSVATVIFDRFCKILFPFWYTKRSRVILVVLTIFSWLSAFIVVVPGLAGFGTYKFRLSQSACVVECSADRACFVFYATLFGVFLSIGSIFPVALYLILCILGIRKAHTTNHIKLGKFGPELESTASFTYTNTPTTLQPLANEDRKMSICSVATTDSSNSSSSKLTFKLPESWVSEIKAVRTFFMIFFNVLSTQLPVYIVSVLSINADAYARIPLAVHLLIVHIYLLGVSLDPLLIMKNQEVTQVLKGSMKKRAARNFNKTNTAILLLEIAKMSSLQEVKVEEEEAKYSRHHSCPNIHQARVELVPIPKAVSHSYAECNTPDTADMILKLNTQRTSEVVTINKGPTLEKTPFPEHMLVHKTVQEDED